MIRRTLKRGFTLIELMIVVAIIGILAAIAIPNFIRFQAKSKQTEAKANLKAVFTAQRSQYQEHDKYLTQVGELGFNPERGNRYFYSLGANTNQTRLGVNTVSTPADTGIEVDRFKFGAAVNPIPAASAFAPTYAVNEGGSPGNTPGIGATVCPACNFLAFAMGDIDNEIVGIDHWAISSVDFNQVPACGDPAATAAPAGVPYNNYDDVNCP